MQSNYDIKLDTVAINLEIADGMPNQKAIRMAEKDLVKKITKYLTKSGNVFYRMSRNLDRPSKRLSASVYFGVRIPDEDVILKTGSK